MNHPPDNGGVRTQPWQEVRRLWPNWNFWEFFGAAKLAHWKPLCIENVLGSAYLWLFYMSAYYNFVMFDCLIDYINLFERTCSLAFLKKHGPFVLFFLSCLFDTTVFCRNDSTSILLCSLYVGPLETIVSIYSPKRTCLLVFLQKQCPLVLELKSN